MYYYLRKHIFFAGMIILIFLRKDGRIRLSDFPTLLT